MNKIEEKDLHQIIVFRLQKHLSKYQKTITMQLLEKKKFSKQNIVSFHK